MKYKIVLDNGKPYETTAETDEDLKKILRDFYIKSNTEDYAYFDAFIYNEKDEDISESQFITEIIGDILNENEVQDE